jgi:glycosyltransferase involved in cell wall biosynthesis
VVEDGKSGLLFPVGDFQKLAQQLARLQGNRDLRAELGRQAVRRVEGQFSLAAMVEQYEAMYGRLAVRRAPARMAVGETRPADIVRARNG